MTVLSAKVTETENARLTALELDVELLKQAIRSIGRPDLLESGPNPPTDPPVNT